MFLICFLLFGFIFPLTVTASGENWLTGWDSRQGITIFGSSGAGTNYQVFLNVTYSATMQSDFDDLRVTRADGETELDYWIEDYTVSTFALVWVEVADNLDSNQMIWMYFGNDGVSTTSNGDDTFQFYEDWSDEILNASIWFTKAVNGVYSFDNTDAKHGSVFKLEGNAGPNTIEIESIDETNASTALMFRSLLELTVAADQRTRMGMATLAGVVTALGIVSSTDGVEQFFVRDDDGNDDIQAMDASAFDSYFVYEITRDGTNAKLYLDRTLIETGSCEPDIKTDNRVIMTVKDSEYDLYSDWIVGRKFIASEPVAMFGVWNELEPAPLVFSVLFDMWGMDTALIILGLVMIPTSGLYLAYGVKHDRSSDRLFYGLIIFILGCGLFIGGIIPP